MAASMRCIRSDPVRNGDPLELSSFHSRVQEFYSSRQVRFAKKSWVGMIQIRAKSGGKSFGYKALVFAMSTLVLWPLNGVMAAAGEMQQVQDAPMPTYESILARQLARRFREMSDEELVVVLEQLIRASELRPDTSQLLSGKSETAKTESASEGHNRSSDSEGISSREQSDASELKKWRGNLSINVGKEASPSALSLSVEGTQKSTGVGGDAQPQSNGVLRDFFNFVLDKSGFPFPDAARFIYDKEAIVGVALLPVIFLRIRGSKQSQDDAAEPSIQLSDGTLNTFFSAAIKFGKSLWSRLRNKDESSSSVCPGVDQCSSSTMEAGRAVVEEAASGVGNLQKLDWFYHKGALWLRDQDGVFVQQPGTTIRQDCPWNEPRQ